jgi:heme/copper-type cytochrome/quinol oxidase subunit 1
MYVRHLTSLQFLTYVGFFAVVIAAVVRFLPGRAPPVRAVPYSDEELGAHDPKLAKYFVAGAGFLVLGGVHMVLKNLPWTAEWLARAGYAGHLVRDLSNTHVMIVGGGTLIATGLCWYALPRIVGRPLTSEALAQCAFWFTAGGLAVFYVALVGDGIAIGRLVQHGWDYQAAKDHLGKWYKVPVGIGAGVMGLGYWCFAANVGLTVFQARLVRVPKTAGHLSKYLATGAAALTVGTVQGVIQVQPDKADWLYRAGHAGEWIDPISHAHINLVTGLTMLVAGALFLLAPALGGTAPSRRTANACFFLLLSGSLSFYGACLYLGFHEGSLVVGSGLTPEQAEEATSLHPFLIVGSGIAMFASFWFLLATIARSFRQARAPARAFVLAGCAALAVGTLQGPVQAVPAVNELLDRGGDAGDVIVNLHAQLNMLGGLMVILVGLGLGLLQLEHGRARPRATRVTLLAVPVGMAVYYTGGLVFSAVEAHAVAGGETFGAAVAALEPWPAAVLVPAALAVLVGFSGYAVSAWSLTSRQRAVGRRSLAALPRVYTGKIPRRVQRRSPAALAGYELPMALLGFPGVGWLFAGFPLTASVLLLGGPAAAWAIIPAAFTPFGTGPLRGVGWKVEFVWLGASALLSSAALYRAHRRRRLRLQRPGPRRRRSGAYRTRVGIAGGAILLLLVSLPFVPAVAGVGSSTLRYSFEPRLTRDVTGQFLITPRGTVKLFSWSDPQDRYPADALRLHAGDIRSLLARAAAVDDAGAYRLFDLTRGRSVALAVRSRLPRELDLVPTRALAPGRYVFTATHEGMFGGRDFAYLQVVPAGEAVTAIASNPRATAPAVIHSLFPVAAALVAVLFAVLLASSFRRRPAGQKALWAVGFLLFAAATSAEAAAQRAGWSPGLFRVYYLCGGVLTVAYLGAGSAWLLLPRRARDALLGALLVASVAAAVTVALAAVDVGTLAATPSGRPPANGALNGHAYVWAIALNSFGTLSLVGGSLYSIVRRRRVHTNVWIGSGAVVLALATGLSRAGDYSFVYGGELVGVAMMFAGFRLVGVELGRRTGRRVEQRSAQAVPG